MKVINGICIVCLVCLAVPQIYAQDVQPIEDANVLDNQKQVLIQKYPHIFKTAVILEVRKIDKDHSMVGYMLNDVYHEAIINSGRKDMLLLETGQLLRPDALPDIVKDNFKKTDKYRTYSIAKAFVVERPAGGKLYRLDIQDPSVKGDLQSVYFDARGNPAKGPR